MQALSAYAERVAIHWKERDGVAVVPTNWVPSSCLREKSFVHAIQYPDIERGKCRSRQQENIGESVVEATSQGTEQDNRVRLVVESRQHSKLGICFPLGV